MASFRRHCHGCRRCAKPGSICRYAHIVPRLRTQKLIAILDLNGDGRAEYLFVHDDGSVDAWLNLGGPDDGPNARLHLHCLE